MRLVVVGRRRTCASAAAAAAAEGGEKQEDCVITSKVKGATVHERPLVHGDGGSGGGLLRSHMIEAGEANK